MAMPPRGSNVSHRRQTRHLRVTSLLAAVLLLPAGTQAQPVAPADPLLDKSLEELMTLEVASVVGAAKHEQKVTEAASSVTIVTRDEIAAFGYRTLAEVLGRVRGLYVSYDRNYSTLGVRGFARPGDYNTRILLLVDGHRMNDNVFDSALLGTEFPLDLDVVERVEIIRGPGSALYGTSAFFAVVNVVTRTAGPQRSTEVSAEAGSQGAWRARATFSTPAGPDRSILVSASRQETDGAASLYFPEFDGTASRGLAVGADGDRAQTLFGRVLWGGLSVQALYGAREKHIPTAAFGTTFGDPRTQTTDGHGYVDASYTRPLGNGGRVQWRGFYDHMWYRGLYTYDDGAVLLHDRAVGRWLGSEGLVSTMVHPRHRLTAGIEYRANLTQEQFNFVDGETDPAPLDARSSQLAGLYAQDEIALYRTVTAVVGGRVDWSSLIGGTGRPRLGLLWHPSARLAVKLLHGAAWRAPNAYEMFYRDPTSKPNPQLRAETLGTTELVVEHYTGKRWRLGANVYTTRIDHLISQFLDPEDGLLFYANREAVRARGVEGEIEHRWVGGGAASVSWAIQRATASDTRERLSNSPRHLGTLRASWPIAGGRVLAAGDAQHVGPRSTLAGGTIDGFWVANGALTVRPHQGVSLTLGVHNLLNRSYGDPGGEEHVQDVIMQDGRTLRMRVTLRF